VSSSCSGGASTIGGKIIVAIDAAETNLLIASLRDDGIEDMSSTNPPDTTTLSESGGRQVDSFPASITPLFPQIAQTVIHEIGRQMVEEQGADRQTAEQVVAAMIRGLTDGRSTVKEY
jgi:hypothetical protein